MSSELLLEKASLAADAADRADVETVPGPARSRFLAAQLAEHGLDSIAELVSAGLPLTEDEAERLLTVSPALLLRIIEGREDLALPRLTEALRPVFFLPVSSMLAEHGRDAGRAELETMVATANALRPEGTSLTIAVDGWQNHRGRFAVPNELVLDTLAELVSGNPDLTIGGPTSGELKSLLSDETDSQALEELLAGFVRAGIRTLEGGGDLRVHRAAAEAGFRLVYAQNLVRSRIIQTGEQAPGRFLAELFRIREELIPLRALDTWHPLTSVVLDFGTPKQEAPLGLELLVAIALGRACLPEVARIRAPISLFGMKVAELAMRFGANDLGFAAIDSQSAEQLGLIRWEVVERELQLGDQQEELR